MIHVSTVGRAQSTEDSHTDKFMYLSRPYCMIPYSQIDKVCIYPYDIIWYPLY